MGSTSYNIVCFSYCNIKKSPNIINCFFNHIC